MLLSVPLQLLNQIVCELPPEHPLSNVRPLRDSLGHTPLQVWCAFFGAYCCSNTYSDRDVYYSLLCLVTNSFHSQVILFFGVYYLSEQRFSKNSCNAIFYMLPNP